MYDAPFLQRGPHNYEPLTPISFLIRSALAYPARPAIVHGDKSFTYAQFYDRCVRVSSTLYHKYNIRYGSTVAAILPNIPEMLELHNAVRKLLLPLPLVSIHMRLTTCKP